MSELDEYRQHLLEINLFCFYVESNCFSGVNDMFLQHPILDQIIQTNVLFVRAIYKHYPTKLMLRYLYRDKQMFLTPRADVEHFMVFGHWGSLKQEDILCLLVMSTPILELKDFVTYLSDLITK